MFHTVLQWFRKWAAVIAIVQAIVWPAVLIYDHIIMKDVVEATFIERGIFKRLDDIERAINNQCPPQDH